MFPILSAKQTPRHRRQWRIAGDARRQVRRVPLAGAEACCALVARPAHAGTMRMKLLRTIRLDPSDAFIFPAAAEPGEWAVPGAFMFFGADLAAFVGKERSA